MKTNIRWESGACLLQMLFYIVAKSHDVIAWHHFHIHNHARALGFEHSIFVACVEGNKLLGFFVLSFDSGYILQAYGGARYGVYPYNLLGNLLFGCVWGSHLQGLAVVDVASYCA